VKFITSLHEYVTRSPPHRHTSIIVPTMSLNS